MSLHLIEMRDHFIHSNFLERQMRLLPNGEAFEIALYERGRLVLKIYLATASYHFPELPAGFHFDYADGVEPIL